MIVEKDIKGRCFCGFVVVNIRTKDLEITTCENCEFLMIRW